MIFISTKSLRIGLFTAGITSLAVCSMLLITSNNKIYADVSTTNQSTPCSQSGNAQTEPSSTTTSDPQTCTSPTDTTNPAPSNSDPNTNSSSNGSSTDNSSCTTPSSNGASDPSTSTTTNATINSCNNLSSSSGDASVSTSGSGGTSSSGNSQDTLNNVNEISTSSNNTTPPSTFNDNVFGDQTGNIVVNPNLASTSQSVGSNITAGTTDTNSTINNNDKLAAYSGNSTVTNGGNGGTATSGNAEAIANIVNIINSMVADQQSFVGTINIYGNLYGDILLPQQLIDQLMGTSGSGPVNQSSISNSATINNNVQLIANSGSATVANFGSGGSATSGNASTTLNIQNYINSIIAANNLFLIIVNVSGQWYGYVLGSIPQTNVFMLGSGLLNQNSTQYSTTTTPVINANETINNNISLSAYSGDAAVYNQGSGGTATSGNAKVVANILNFVNDSFNITGWFGVLFINIFGNWYGSISTYDANADPITQNVDPVISNASINNDPTDPNSYNGMSWSLYVISPSFNTSSDTNSNSLDNIKNTAVKSKAFSMLATTAKPLKHINYWLAVISLIPILLVIIFERFVYNKNR